MQRLHLFTGLMLCSLVCGCGTSRPWTSVASRFGRTPAEKDALALDENQMSSGFREAQGKLKDAERTMLMFARWKEDTGMYGEAKRRYQEVLTENNDCLPARLGIARIERQTGRFDQCRAILQEAQKQYPKEPTIPLEIGRMYGDRDEWDQAIVAYKSAAEVAPDDETVRYELGVALAHAARYEEALSHLKYAVGDSAALYNVGYILHESGRQEESARWFEQALKQHPDERTEQLASSMLAELKLKENQAAPVLPGRTADSEAVAFVRPQQTQFAEYSRQQPTVMPVSQQQMQSARLPVRTAVQTTAPYSQQASGIATYKADAGSEPAQWRGPGQSRVPVHTTTLSQAVDSVPPTDPPAWR